MRTAGVVLGLIVCSVGAWAGLEDMIPAAKEVQMLEEAVPIAGGAVYLMDDSTQAEIAAAEINSRIEELGGQALPRHKVSGAGAEPIVDIPASPAIVLGTADGDGPGRLQSWMGPEQLNLTATDPGPQGYVIRCRQSEALGMTCVLAGSDRQGMLYAAVTFRHMLEASEDGVVIRAANVRDWPDFKHRNLGSPYDEPLREDYYALRDASREGDMERARQYAARHLATMQWYIDWLLRHKINMMGAHGRASADAGATKFEREVTKQVNDYARERGIISVWSESISIGSYPEDKDNPDFADIVMHTAHKRYFCWSRLQYHREKATRIANFMGECGFGALYLHDVDGGGWQNPAMWDDRCELCRETYGDDHAKADAVVFGIYYDTMREQVPDGKFFAVIYPYTPSSIDPGSIAGSLRSQMGDVPGIEEIAENAAHKNRRFLERLNSLVPDDWHICIRENERERVDLMREVWHPKPFYTYFEYMHWRSFQPWFSTSPRMTGTFYYEGYDDVIYGSIPGWGFRNPLRVYAAENAWNSRGADYETFDPRVRSDYTKIQAPRELAERWALKISADLYGHEVAPYMVPLFTLNLSPPFIFKPEEVGRGIDDVTEVLGHQFEAATECCASMEQLFDKILAREITPKPDLFGEVTNYYRFVVAAKVLAGYKHEKGLLEQAIVEGDEDAEATALHDLQQHLAVWESELAYVKDRTKDLPILESEARQTVAKGYLLALNIDELREDLQALLERKSELAATYSMPDWFRSYVSERELYATHAQTPLVIDGKLNEEVWQRAEPIEHFVRYDQLRLASRETVARVCYDEDNLYVAFEGFDPAPGEIDIPARDPDRHQPGDSVEVLVDSNDDNETFVHYILDLGGNLFDAVRLRQEDEILKYDTKWNGNLGYELSRLDDRWIAELAIPTSDLGRAPKQGDTWGIHIARNIAHGLAESESVAAAYLDGQGFRTVAEYPPLRLVGPQSRVKAPKVAIEVRNESVQPKVHEAGDATEVKFDLRLTTDRSLHNVRVVARLLDAERTQVLEQTVMESLWVELLWQSRRPIFLEVIRSYEGLLLELEVTSDEGTWKLEDKLGNYRSAAPSGEELYGPGYGEGRSLAATMFCPSLDYVDGQPRHFVPSAQGTIECWVCPTEDVVADQAADYLMRTIVDIGPVRYSHPHLTNYRTMAIFVNQTGELFFPITTAKWDNRTTQCRVDDWKAGQWHHVACQWQLNDGGKCRMAVFVDGKLAGDQVRGNKEGEPDAAMKRKDEMLPIQVGAMNTGYGPAKMLIDELRFSLVPRYQGEFEAANRLTADAQTSLLFHFDAGLEVESGLEGVKVIGEAGTVG